MMNSSLVVVSRDWHRTPGPESNSCPFSKSSNKVAGFNSMKPSVANSGQWNRSWHWRFYLIVAVPTDVQINIWSVTFSPLERRTKLLLNVTASIPNEIRIQQMWRASSLLAWLMDGTAEQPQLTKWLN